MRKTPFRVFNALVAVTWILLLPMALAAAPGDRSAKQDAGEILKQSGIVGGLIVHVGGDDGRLTAALGANETLLVQGWTRDPNRLEEARETIQSMGRYGAVSVELWEGKRLPYADHMVNLLVLEEADALDSDEIARVMAPGGAICVRRSDGWSVRRQKWPEQIDDWPHYLYGADNNAVANDTVVGPPTCTQWIAGPRFSRTHDHLASVSALVTSGGRIYYIVDQGSIAFAGARADWKLVARDAFSGVMLWQRDIPAWEHHLRDFRSGPADIARRLVAKDDRVYVTLGYDEPVSVLDGATGGTLQTFPQTEGTQEILLSEGRLYLVLGERDVDWDAAKAKEIVSQQDYHPPVEETSPPTHRKRVLVVEANSGKTIWKADTPATQQIMPSTLAVSEGRVFFQNPEAIVCLEAQHGQLLWTTPRPVQKLRLAWSTPTLVAYDGVVYSADRRAEDTESELLWMPSGGYHQYIRGEGAEGELVALDAADGKQFWSCPAYEGFNAPVDILIADGLLWTGRYAWGNDPGVTAGRDLKTGEIVRTRQKDSEVLPRIGHARCHRAKATEEYLILGRRGIEMIDLETGHMTANRWVRGMCQYGVMPANGLIYIPPHSCACSHNDLLKSGFMALASENSASVTVSFSENTKRFQGPAYGAAEEEDLTPASASWPMYRHDSARSGSTETRLPEDIGPRWTSSLGGKLTPPVLDRGIVVVARKDTHQIHALDSETGKILWSYSSGGRIDSSPTISRGCVYFGSADGQVYCLTLETGELVWRHRPASSDRRIVADEQIESVWPVNGSVLVLKDAVYFAVGRNSYLDGGMALVCLDAKTGRKRRSRALTVTGENRDAGIVGKGYLPDLLSTDGRSLFMRSHRFGFDFQELKPEVPHLWSSVGFLDDTWWHRTYWLFGTTMHSGWGGWPKVGQEVPAGRLLVFDDATIFGFGRTQYDRTGAHVGVDAGGVWAPIGKEQGRWTDYRLFARPLDARPPAEKRREAPEVKREAVTWERDINLMARAMLLAGDKLYLGGIRHSDRPFHDPESSDPLAAALDSEEGGRLLVVDAEDGRSLGDIPLTSPPVFDGMAAGGQLYLSNRKGEVVCFGATE